MKEAAIFLAGVFTPILILFVIVLVIAVRRQVVSGANSRERVKENIVAKIGE